MGSAATDRLVTARKARKHNGRLLKRLKVVKARVDYALELANEAADERVEHHQEVANARIRDAHVARDLNATMLGRLRQAHPFLSSFERIWFRAGFFRRLWNAVRYVIIGEAVWNG